jgi:hypothetical protein
VWARNRSDEPPKVPWLNGMARRARFDRGVRQLPDELSQSVGMLNSAKNAALNEYARSRRPTWTDLGAEFQNARGSLGAALEAGRKDLNRNFRALDGQPGYTYQSTPLKGFVEKFFPFTKGVRVVPKSLSAALMGFSQTTGLNARTVLEGTERWARQRGLTPFADELRGSIRKLDAGQLQDLEKQFVTLAEAGNFLLDFGTDPLNAAGVGALKLRGKLGRTVSNSNAPAATAGARRVDAVSSAKAPGAGNDEMRHLFAEGKPGERADLSGHRYGTFNRAGFYEPSVVGSDHLVAKTGVTNEYGDVMYSTRGTPDEVEMVKDHELLHSYLSPKFIVLQDQRARLAKLGYKHSQFLRYLEEAMAQGYAEMRSRGLRGLPDAFTFPIRHRGSDGSTYRLEFRRILKEGGVYVGGVIIAAAGARYLVKMQRLRPQENDAQGGRR